MNKYYLVLLVVLFSCSPNQEISSDLEDIKRIGDVNPIFALEKLDSLSSAIHNESELERMKRQLLEIRLQDKAYIVPESTTPIKNVLHYFLTNGSILEKQEALYYAGSVYRDLQDIPASIDLFLQSKDIAEANSEDCDHTMLRNTYSNLSYLYSLVQDNNNFLQYAKKEYEISLSLGQITENCIMHMGDAYFYCDSISTATIYYEEVLDRIDNSNKPDRNRLTRLLYRYSYLQDRDKTTHCYQLLDSLYEHCPINPKELLALGEYYKLFEKNDSAIMCYQRILDEESDLLSKYDAARHLFRLSQDKGDSKNAILYGDLFIKISGELNFGKRQELVATVNNIYKYNKDKEEEQRLIIENQSYHNRIVKIVSGFVILLAIVLVILFYYRYLQLKRILLLNTKIKNINKEKESIAKDLTTKKSELESSKMELGKVVIDLAEIQQTLDNKNVEIQKLEEELIDKENILKEKIEQNKTIISLMHQTEFVGNAEEIIQSLKKAGNGYAKMTEKDWNKLYSAVDKLWPTFKEDLCSTLGVVTGQERQIGYLIRAGFNKNEIQNMTGLSRATVWRWIKKFDWINSII